MHHININTQCDIYNELESKYVEDYLCKTISYFEEICSLQRHITGSCETLTQSTVTFSSKKNKTNLGV